MKQYHILIAFSLLATIGLTSCGDRPQNAPNNIATPVSVVELKKGSISKLINTTGTVQPTYGVSLNSEMSGFYKLQINPKTGKTFKMGDRVSKGTIIVRLEDKEYENGIAIDAKKLSLEIAEHPAATATPAPAAHAAKDTVLSACLNGTVVPLADVKDEAFASGALGDGIAIEPTDGELVAPADGEISSTFETHHAVGMTTADGAELLMHIGIDTVKLGGKHFTYLVNEGDKVKKGQPLIRFELEAIKAEGYPVTTPLIVCNTDDYAAVAAKASGTVKQGDALLELKH